MGELEGKQKKTKNTKYKKQNILSFDGRPTMDRNHHEGEKEKSEENTEY